MNKTVSFQKSRAICEIPLLICLLNIHCDVQEMRYVNVEYYDMCYDIEGLCFPTDELFNEKDYREILFYWRAFATIQRKFTHFAVEISCSLSMLIKLNYN